MKKVLILFGGDSNEHLVSCKSAKGILENIDTTKFEVTSVGIKKDWYIFNDNYSFFKKCTLLCGPKRKRDGMADPQC